jgi:glycolate oxidase iron-sulfur subunit
MKVASPPQTPRVGTYVAGDAPAKELIQRCVHCGFCLPSCPTYAVLGVEMDSPRGRIRLMKSAWEGRIGPGNAGFGDHLYMCLDCRACETACPSGVEFGKLVEAGRGQIERARPRPLAERIVRSLVFDQLLPHRGRLAAVTRLTYVAKRIGVGTLLGLVAPRVGLAKRLRDMLDLVPAQRPTGARLPSVVPAAGTRRARVALFEGCVQRAAFGATNEATARVLARNGMEVVVVADQTCCGALHVHAGERDGGRALARRNIAAFSSVAGGSAPAGRAGLFSRRGLRPLPPPDGHPRDDTPFDAIVVNAAGCGANLKEYGWLLKDDPAWSERAQRFSAKVRDATEILDDMGLTAAPGRIEASVAYDEPCHLLHGQKVSAQPKALLAAIPGLRVVPLTEADWCCGSAGVYNVTQPDLSRTLLHRKMEHVRRAAPDILVTANPGCLMQLMAGVREAGLRMEVVHLIDLLDRAYRSSQGASPPSTPA